MMMNGVWFDDKHSYRYYKMILSNVTVGYPTVKTRYIDIPRGDGTLDSTEAFGGVKYNDRTLTFNFTVIGKWDRVKEQAVNELHGKKVHIILDKDAEYYYTGRCTIDEWKSDRNLKTITVTAVCEPYKNKRNITVQTAVVAGNGSILCRNDFKSVIPVIECDSDMILTMNGESHALKKGKQKVLDVKFEQGYNRMNVSGNGKITFTYQEGAL